MHSNQTQQKGYWAFSRF